MLTPRLARLKEIIFDLEQIKTFIPRQDISYQPEEGKSAIRRHAESYSRLLKEISVNHIPEERIVGNNVDKYSPRPDHLTPQEYEQIQAFPRICSPELLSALEEECFYLWAWSDGHILPGYEKVLRLGGKGIMKKLEARLEDPGLTIQQREFLEAALLQWQAGLDYVDRHRVYFENLAAQAEDEEKKEYYRELAEVCARVPAEPARSFREALQSVWFTFILGQFDDCSNHSLGRLDQYLYPYYRYDLENGVLSEDEAKELFFEFWLKFNIGYRLQEIEKIRIEGKGGGEDEHYDPKNGISWLTLRVIDDTHPDIGQTIDLCGLDEEGQDATNAISWLALAAVEELRTFEPKPVVNVTEKTDPEFLKKCCQINATGMGLPSFSFYNAVSKGLQRYGVFDDEDIRNHSHIGCVEVGIPAKSYTDPMNCFMNLPKIVLITLNGGFYGGKKLGLEMPPAATWEEFAAQFRQQLDYFVGLYADTMNLCYPFYSQFFHRPFISTIIEDCIEKATPVDRGGARYWVKGLNCTGFASAVNSLYAIKEAVFENGEIGLEELRTVLAQDYKGHEDLRLKLQNRVAKYGNDNGAVDDMAREVNEWFCKTVQRYRTHLGTPYRPGLYSFYGPVKTMGKATGATPDGRKAGDIVSLNSAPAHGSIKNGLSAVLHSISNVDHSLADNAATVDVKLNAGIPPEIINNILTYAATKDLLYLQFSVVNQDDLINAQQFPEQYQDLIVRVTGFSARFLSLPKETQDEIIRRSYWA